MLIEWECHWQRGLADLSW